MKKEAWVEKPEWQELREQGRRVIAHQHVHSDQCTPNNCMHTRDEQIKASKWLKDLDKSGKKIVYVPSTFEYTVVPK